MKHFFVVSRYASVAILDYATLSQSFAPLVVSSSASSLAQLNQTNLESEDEHADYLDRSKIVRSSFCTHQQLTNNNDKHNTSVAKIISNGGPGKMNSAIYSNSFNRSSSYTPNTNNEYKLFKDKLLKNTTEIINSNNNSNNNNNTTTHNFTDSSSSSRIDDYYQIPVIDYSNKDYVITRL